MLLVRMPCIGAGTGTLMDFTPVTRLCYMVQWMTRPNHIGPLKAKSFLKLVVQEEVRKTDSSCSGRKQTLCCQWTVGADDKELPGKAVLG